MNYGYKCIIFYYVLYYNLNLNMNFNMNLHIIEMNLNYAKFEYYSMNLFQGEQ